MMLRVFSALSTKHCGSSGAGRKYPPGLAVAAGATSRRKSTGKLIWLWENRAGRPMHRWFIWNVIFRLHERAKSHNTYSFLREMEAADRMSASELQELQRRKLSDLLEYASVHVPYFRGRLQEA